MNIVHCGILYSLTKEAYERQGHMSLQEISSSGLGKKVSPSFKNMATSGNLIMDAETLGKGTPISKLRGAARDVFIPTSGAGHALSAPNAAGTGFNVRHSGKRVYDMQNQIAKLLAEDAAGTSKGVARSNRALAAHMFGEMGHTTGDIFAHGRKPVEMGLLGRTGSKAESLAKNLASLSSGGYTAAPLSGLMHTRSGVNPEGVGATSKAMLDSLGTTKSDDAARRASSSLGKVTRRKAISEIMKMTGSPVEEAALMLDKSLSGEMSTMSEYLGKAKADIGHVKREGSRLGKTLLGLLSKIRR